MSAKAPTEPLTASSASTTITKEESTSSEITGEVASPSKSSTSPKLSSPAAAAAVVVATATATVIASTTNESSTESTASSSAKSPPASIPTVSREKGDIVEQASETLATNTLVPSVETTIETPPTPTPTPTPATPTTNSTTASRSPTSPPSGLPTLADGPVVSKCVQNIINLLQRYGPLTLPQIEFNIPPLNGERVRPHQLSHVVHLLVAMKVIQQSDDDRFCIQQGHLRRSVVMPSSILEEIQKTQSEWKASQKRQDILIEALKSDAQPRTVLKTLLLQFPEVAFDPVYLTALRNLHVDVGVLLGESLAATNNGPANKKKKRKRSDSTTTGSESKTSKKTKPGTSTTSSPPPSKGAATTTVSVTTSKESSSSTTIATPGTTSGVSTSPMPKNASSTTANGAATPNIANETVQPAPSTIGTSTIPVSTKSEGLAITETIPNHISPTLPTSTTAKDGTSQS